MITPSMKVATAAIVIGLSACTAAPTKTAMTPSRVYGAPEDKVFNASVAAFQNLGLDLFNQDKSLGYVEGGRSPGFGRGAERVGVYIERQTPSGTKVSIDNKKSMWGYVFAVDWTDKMFLQISSELNKNP